MADWPPVAPTQTSPSPQEKERTYLTLVDMFVDIVEPAIIQMVLQNRNWDVDAALEDIMILTNSTQPDLAQKTHKTSVSSEAHNQLKVKSPKYLSPRGENAHLHQYSPSYTENKAAPTQQKFTPQSKQKKQMFDKPVQFKEFNGKKGNQLELQPFLEQYQYVKAARVPFDRAVMLIKDGVKVMIILRGPPGCGKSFLARKLLKEGGIDPSAHKRHIFSTDEFFVQNNVYVYVPELLSQAHLWNQRSVATAIREEVSPVIVDNTNTQAWEMRVYVEMAVSAGYDLEIMEPDTWWFKREGELAKRNVHGVPKAKIRQMMERYERNITPDLLMRQFDLRYPLSKTPPQPARNCKWRDKLSNQRNNKPKKKKSDFSPMTQRTSGIDNSMYQSFQINSSFSPVGNASAYQNNSKTMPYFHYDEIFPKDNNDEIRYKNINQIANSQIPPNELKFEETTNTFSSFKNGDNTYGLTFGDESDTNKLFENLVTSPRSFLESIKETSKCTQEQTQPSDQSSNFVPPGNSLPQTFDFMAETRKLLEALGRPSNSDMQSTNSQNHSNSQNFLEEEALVNLMSQQSVVPSSILICKEREIFLPSEQCSSTETPKNDVSKTEDYSSSEDKIRVAHDLIDTIIDKAVGDIEGSCRNNLVDEELKSDRGLLWDYVVVNDDKTFTYQRNNSIPIGLPVKITENRGSCSQNVQKTESVDSIFSNETVLQFENKYENDRLSDNGEQTYDNSKQEPQILHRFADNNETFSLQSHIRSENEFCIEENPSQLNMVEDSHSSSPTSAGGDEKSHLDSGNSAPQEADKSGENIVESGTKSNPNMLEIMKDILFTLGPLNENYTSSLGNNADGNITDVKNPKFPQNDPEHQTNDGFEISSTAGDNIFGNMNVGNEWENTGNIFNEESQPKPARSLRRPKLPMNTVKYEFKDPDYLKYLGNWDTVSNAAETWCVKNTVEPADSKDATEGALPQRCSPQRSQNSKKVVDSSTNTNYLDFSLVANENPTGVKVLIGNINTTFSESSPEVNQNMAETLLLDKGTMTIDESATASGYDITQIMSLFPHIPERYIKDMVERCQGDIDWAVDLLLDSEHVIAPISSESEGDSESKEDDRGLERNQDEIIPPPNVVNGTSPKREPKSPTYEQTELKKLIENSVVFDKTHYSDKILKVLKRKHPEYAQLVENSSQEDRNADKSETADVSQDECETEDEVDEVEEESSSSGGCEVETEDDTMDLIMNNDLILQLQQKFGTSPLPKINDLTPIVKLPLSFARQLFGYIMDSLQSDMDEQQSRIEEMIARDEEVARLLQFQDQNSRPQLQEVMDMEIALAMHKADQEEWSGKGNETLAAKLSRNILLEKFPHVDPRMLSEVLQAHNYSLADTVDSLTLGLGVGPAPPPSAPRPPDPPKEEKERMTSIIVSDDVGVNAAAVSAANPVSEAAVHRAQAASYYNLRMECLNKAHEAFRSGNKTVATYYSQLAQIHKERMEQSNSKAAACLFASHKTGANTLDLHFLHIREAEVVLDMFLDEVVTYISERNKRHQTVFLITGRGLRSVGGVSRIKPMVQRKLQGRGIPYNEVNPGMLSAIVRNVTPLSYTL